MDVKEFARYLEELEKTRARFPGLSILSGVEADYVAGREESLSKFLSSYPFDFVLMSIHFIAEWPSDQWVFDFGRDPGRWRASTTTTSWRCARESTPGCSTAWPIST